MADSGTAEKKSRAAPRTAEEIRRLLLESARALFASQGYGGTSTREIAVHAGVSEALLFRHFGTKAKLFERAVLDPIEEFVHDWVSEWKARPITDHTPEAVARTYVDGSYRLLCENRELVMALINAKTYESLEALDDAEPFSKLLDELEVVAARESEARDYDFDVPVAIRIVAGMVMSMALLDGWLFPTGRRRPSRQRIVDEMVAFMVRGLASRDSLAPGIEASG